MIQEFTLIFNINIIHDENYKYLKYHIRHMRYTIRTIYLRQHDKLLESMRVTKQGGYFLESEINVAKYLVLQFATKFIKTLETLYI